MGKTPPAKVRVHGNVPNVTEGFLGIVVEALCGRSKPQPVLFPPRVYQGWTQEGFTNEIFCGDCVREIALQ